MTTIAIAVLVALLALVSLYAFWPRHVEPEPEPEPPVPDPRIAMLEGQIQREREDFSRTLGAARAQHAVDLAHAHEAEDRNRARLIEAVTLTARTEHAAQQKAFDACLADADKRVVALESMIARIQAEAARARDDVATHHADELENMAGRLNAETVHVRALEARLADGAELVRELEEQLGSAKLAYSEIASTLESELRHGRELSEQLEAVLRQLHEKPEAPREVVRQPEAVPEFAPPVAEPKEEISLVLCADDGNPEDGTAAIDSADRVPTYMVGRKVYQATHQEGDGTWRYRHIFTEPQ